MSNQEQALRDLFLAREALKAAQSAPCRPFTLDWLQAAFGRACEAMDKVTSQSYGR